MPKCVVTITYDEADAQAEGKERGDEDWTLTASEAVENSTGRLFGGEATVEIDWVD